MQTIAATATVVPPFVLPREDVKQAVARIFELSPRRLDALMAIYDHARVDQRYSVFPLEHLIRPRSLTEKIQEYRRHAVSLGSRAARDCLDRGGLRPADVDLLISVSCTGYMVPSLDAYLVQELGFRSNVRRLPITELGCVGGAVALSRATEFVSAFPDSHALVVAVELSSLTFQPDDMSDANLVSCAFFGDGAAAALVTGGEMPGARVLDTESCLLPGLPRCDGVRPRATIIFVLDAWLRGRRPAVVESGIAVGFGPGVSAELLLLQWA